MVNLFLSCFYVPAIRRACWLSLFLLFSSLAQAQNVQIKGLVKDTQGQSLPFANVLLLPDSLYAPANIAGNFSATIKGGPKTIKISYTGYEPLQISLLLRRDTTLNFTLKPDESQLETVTITADRYSQQALVESTRSGTTTLTRKDIMAIPVLGGEADIIKTLQLLPGTVRGVEGSSDLFVRGGAADQNLVLLDGAPIYNTSHLFGFLSVFNPDILDKVEAINGGFPAQYGGRLSSILDISSNSSIAERTLVSGEIGLLASRLYVEQPLIKNKASIWLAGRRTYIDRVVKAIGEELPYFFYDLNGKLSLKPGRRDQLDLSFYGGEDILDYYRDRNNDGSGFTSTFASGNTSQSIQWRRQLDADWRSNFALTRSVYKYRVRNAFEENELVAFSEIEDYGANISIEKDSVWRDAHLKAGIEWTRHAISPNVINSSGNFANFLESSESSGKVAHEVALHVQQEVSLSPKLRINTGLRTSMALVADKNYFIPEPRISVRYALPHDQALKLSYSRMAQYIHRISNSAISSPTDIWYPVTSTIGPQRSHQLSAAWQRYLGSQSLFLSVEGYYKTMQNLVGFQEGTNLFFNTDFESKLIQGRGQAYGLEFLLRKEAGKFTGWISYTLSWSWRQFDQMNGGSPFPARYDRRHNGAVVMQYALGKRWAASAVWEFISGSRFTPVIGQYIAPAPTLSGVDLIPVFSGINEVKLSDTHRLDLGLKFMSKPGRKFQWHWFAGVNNAYNRASPLGIFIETDENTGVLRYSQPGLFGLLPFISYGFRF